MIKQKLEKEMREAYEILKEIGFPYVATFKDHKVSFVEIR